MIASQTWRRTSSLAALAAVAALVIAGLVCPGSALAHERREVAGYQFVVGFISEPALEGQKNGVDLRVSKAEKPVEGLEKTLQVEVTHLESGTKKTFALRTIFRDPGHYTADLIPTVAGQYRFRFFGTIEGRAIDETFTSGPETFSNITSTTDLLFPLAVAQPRELTAGVRGATEAAELAADRADAARTLAIAGIAIGIAGLVIGLGAGALAWRRR